MYDYFERISEINTARVLDAFRAERVSDAMFAGTTGYGYSDTGRDAFERVFARVFGGEAALARPAFSCGTHAIACALFAACRPGDTLVSVIDAPYDTLMAVIDGNPGSLTEYGVKYSLGGDGDVYFIQRSRGYSSRECVDTQTLRELTENIKSRRPDAIIVVDNCYCEFCDTVEPPMLGADLTAGSLIKNPGGGLAPCGGYIVGRRDLIDRAAARLNAPGIAGEVGAWPAGHRPYFQGLFYAPHAVGQALKTAAYAAKRFAELGYDTSPAFDSPRADIIQELRLNDPEKLKKFCRAVQSASPVDSFLRPEPWDMPGYDCKVVMAAGTFVQGGSLELTCDAPMREPYSVYVQGGLTFEAGKYAIDRAVGALL